jgi:hypothetical protein
LHNEYLHDSYSVPDIILLIKCRRMRGASQMIRGGENRNIYVILVGKLGQNGRLEDLRLDGGVMLIWQKEIFLCVKVTLTHLVTPSPETN